MKRIVTRPVLGVVRNLPRARVTAEKDSVVRKSSCVRILLTYLTIVDNVDTPLSGVVCDSLRTQVTEEKDQWCSRSAPVMV